MNYCNGHFSDLIKIYHVNGRRNNTLNTRAEKVNNVLLITTQCSNAVKWWYNDASLRLQVKNMTTLNKLFDNVSRFTVNLTGLVVDMRLMITDISWFFRTCVFFSLSSLFVTGMRGRRVDYYMNHNFLLLLRLFRTVGGQVITVMIALYIILNSLDTRGDSCVTCVRGCGNVTVRRVGGCRVPTDVALTRNLLRSNTKGDRLTRGSGGRFNVGYRD